MTKPDDSSLSHQQHITVRRAAIALLNKAEAWDRFPTPIPDLLEAAKLRVAPISAFDQSAIERYACQLTGVATRFLKSAIEKVWGILDVFGNVVHVDPTVSKEKQTFLKLHETGHSELPHQRGIFKWIQDCKQTLAPDASDLFEREANTFASIVLFQDTRFATMTSDSDFGIKIPLSIGRRFGASAYASIREYVRKSDKACAVIVLEPAQLCSVNGTKASVRRVDLSPDFIHRFGGLHLPTFITSANSLAQFIPVGGRRMSRAGTLALEDRNAVLNEFVAEGFCTPYNVFILMHARATLNKTTVILHSHGPSAPL